jgi:hypothetical protein
MENTMQLRMAIRECERQMEIADLHKDKEHYSAMLRECIRLRNALISQELPTD